MIIRKAGVEDADAIAALLLLAMEDIIFQFIGKEDRGAARNFLRYFTFNEANQYSYENCWVAEMDGEVVAAVNLYDGSRLHALRKPVMDYIRSQFGQEMQPEDETQAGEYYIDSIGVRPDQQGRGIGTKLLLFLIDEYAGRRSQTLGLLVDEENANAKRLYLSLGFKIVGRKILLGKVMEHLQM